eukprot:1874518-Karenia_brevis.AAC.1
MEDAPVGYYGEFGTLGGRRTVPRAELIAVMRALLAVEHYGHRVTAVTIWSDSKIVVDGYSKGMTHTLQSMLVADWEELWDRVQALRDR